MLVVTSTVGPVVSALAAESPPITTEEEAVTFVERIVEMKGHLNASMHWASAGNTAEAREHAKHPKDEYWNQVGPSIRDANATFADRLKSKLDALPSKAKTMTPSEYRAHVTEEIYPLLETAIDRTVAADARSSLAFEGQVATKVLERIEVEYGNGLNDDGKVLNLVEYWDARGFANVLETRYDGEIAPELSAENAREIGELIETLQQKIESKSAPGDLQPTLDKLSHEIEEYTSSGESESQSGAGSPAATIDQINDNLDRVVTLYEQDKPAEAKKLLTETYLSLFEGLEGPLIEQRPQLVETLEAQFNEDLPTQIDSGAPVSEIEATVQEMKSNLAEAKTVLADRKTATLSVAAETTDTGGPGFVALGAIAALLVAGLFVRR
ncbi:MAG: PGF-CTERM sorting domain-containing protein [Halococcoides sp.]